MEPPGSICLTLPWRSSPLVMIAVGYSEPMDASETAEIQRIRRLCRIAVIAAITLAVLVLVAVGVYLIAFVILSPMLG